MLLMAYVSMLFTTVRANLLRCGQNHWRLSPRPSCPQLAQAGVYSSNSSTLHLKGHLHDLPICPTYHTCCSCTSCTCPPHSRPSVPLFSNLIITAWPALSENMGLVSALDMRRSPGAAKLKICCGAWGLGLELQERPKADSGHCRVCRVHSMHRRMHFSSRNYLRACMPAQRDVV